MPRFRSNKMFADMKLVTDRLYKCLTRIDADPLMDPAEEFSRELENSSQDFQFLSECISNFTLTCWEDLMGTNKKICDLYRELKGLEIHHRKVKENFPKDAHPAVLVFLLQFNDPIVDLRKQLQKETGFDPHIKDWHLKMSSSPLYESFKKAHLGKEHASSADPQEKSDSPEGYSLPYFMEPLNLRQELKERYLRLWKFVCNPELDFEKRIYASLIFELDEELGKCYDKNLVDLYMAEFCLDKKKSRKARAYRCKNQNPKSKESDDYKLLGKDPEFEERVRQLL